MSIHGIERDNGCQRRLILIDEIAQRVVIAADPTADGRAYLAEAEIELVDSQRRLGSLNRCVGLDFLRLIGVEFLLGGKRRLREATVRRGRVRPPNCKRAGSITAERLIDHRLIRATGRSKIRRSP